MVALFSGGISETWERMMWETGYRMGSTHEGSCPALSWASKDSSTYLLPGPPPTLRHQQADPAGSWWPSEYLQGLVKTGHQHWESTRVFLKGQTVWVDRTCSQSFLNASVWIILWIICIFSLFLLPLQAGGRLGVWLPRGRNVSELKVELSRRFLSLFWKPKHVRDGFVGGGGVAWEAQERERGGLPSD